jgi:hypothetical protein
MQTAPMQTAPTQTAPMHNMSMPKAPVVPEPELRQYANSLQTPTPSYPNVYPLYRNDRYDPDELDSELLEGYSLCDEFEYNTGMSFGNFLLWIILIALIIYAIYYFSREDFRGSANLPIYPEVEAI